MRYIILAVDASRLGSDVVGLRRKAGLTQAELARRARTTQAVISRLENGLRLPGPQVLDRIADQIGPLRLTFGSPSPVSRAERRRRVRKVLGHSVFDPWERDPSPEEARSLIADGLGPERFARR